MIGFTLNIKSPLDLSLRKPDDFSWVSHRNLKKSFEPAAGGTVRAALRSEGLLSPPGAGQRRNPPGRSFSPGVLEWKNLLDYWREPFMTRRTFLGLLQAALFGSAAAVTPTESKAFDIDEGRRYDAQGRYQGREDSSGRRYDAQGRYQGRRDD